MTFGEKLTYLRKSKGYTQEDLAEMLNVSRQSVGKWETDLAYPETEKIIKLTEIFVVSIDYLLNENIDENSNKTVEMTENNENNISFFDKFILIKERKSSKTILGLPLYHIGRNARGFFAVGLNSRGVFALGLKAKGIFSFGLLSIGILSFGLLSLGFVAFAMLSMGLLSFGAISIGFISFGAISIGVLSVGAVSLGCFSLGAVANGKYFAVGDKAWGMVVIGKTYANGTVYEAIVNITKNNIHEAIVKLKETNVVPKIFEWIENLIFNLSL